MTEAQKIEEVAARLGTNPQWLDALINFETGGTYSPTIKNPLSSARGLIQIVDVAAYSVFKTDSLTLTKTYDDFESQMDNVVYPYLAHYAPFPTKQSLYMSVFYPAYRTVPPTTVFPESVQVVNPGIHTVQDYIDFVDKRIKTTALRLPKVALLPVLLAAGVGIYLLAGKHSIL